MLLAYSHSETQIKSEDEKATEENTHLGGQEWQIYEKGNVCHSLNIPLEY